MGFNNHQQRSTPPYYLDVDNPLVNESMKDLLNNFDATFGFVWKVFSITSVKLGFSHKHGK